MFVGASVVVLAMKSLRQSPPAVATGSQTAGDRTAEVVEPTITDGVVAYYFHGKTRSQKNGTGLICARQA